MTHVLRNGWKMRLRFGDVRPGDLSCAKGDPAELVPIVEVKQEVGP